MDSAIEKFAELQVKDSEDSYGLIIDKCQAISGLDFKRVPPNIRDDDLDIDRHGLDGRIPSEAKEVLAEIYAVAALEMRD